MDTMDTIEKMTVSNIFDENTRKSLIYSLKSSKFDLIHHLDTMDTMDTVI